MNGRRWIVLTLAIILAGMIIDGIVAYAFDPFGVLRDTHGRALPIDVISTGRKAKYLLSQRYVPENYDALILGPSSVANWDVSQLGDTRVYNLSVDGGDAAEEKILLDQALKHGRYKIAVCALVPNMTNTDEVRGGLDSTSVTEALGSLQSFIQDATHIVRALHHGAGFVDIAANGHYNYRKQKDLAVVEDDPATFAIKPDAVEKYRQMIDELRKRGTAIVYVVPPLYGPFYERNKIAYDGYVRQIELLLQPAPVIDFRDPRYAALADDANNFVDVQHLEPAATKLYSTLLEERVPLALAAPEK